MDAHHRAFRTVAQWSKPMADQQPTRLLSIPEAAKSLGINRSTIYRLVTAGKIPLIKLGSRSLLDPADLNALIAAGKRVAA
jgi:excisionase family DNA binding protein